MKTFLSLLSLSSMTIGGLSQTPNRSDFPLTPDDIEVRLFAKEPLVRNPCALTFDHLGRLFVGMGPQYRKPKPETPGDSVWLLDDTNHDGEADGRTEFAKGFNAIQGLAWRGMDLWVANAPDLTVVRDTDGDDIADEYVRVYTDLGNLEHGIHGLNFAPDGMLYMSKGNSKGLTQRPNRVAPKAFRDLWGLPDLPGTPDLPHPRFSGRDDYQKNYHHPSDDWGRSGGVLRCYPDGTGLTVVTAGSRNPWDITYDSAFNWLGTDNDQTLGDKIFNPFYGAHFGWSHTWSFDWEGNDHLPTAPSSGPLFEGSGTGVLFVDHPAYPDKYRGAFLINDWLKRKIYLYHPVWSGAWMQPADSTLPVLADAGTGRSMERSSGRRFDPVDIEMGPDGALYISSWGREYGLKEENGTQVNEGRIYRLWPKAFSPTSQPASPQPLGDLGSHLPARRLRAQEKLVRQGPRSIPDLLELIHSTSRTTLEETWAIWTLWRIAANHPELERLAADGSSNQQLQAIRALGRNPAFPRSLASLLDSPNARLRQEALLGIQQSRETHWVPDLLAVAAVETDRIVRYTLWRTLQQLLPRDELIALLTHSESGVRQAAFLALLEDDALEENQIADRLQDTDITIRQLAAKRLGGKAEAIIKGSSLEVSGTGDPLPEERPAVSNTPIHLIDELQSASGKRYTEARLTERTLAYHDRAYRITNIPDSFKNATFIRVCNSDADQTTGTGLTFKLRYPSRVYLADDENAEQLPAWARDKFTATEDSLQVAGGVHRLYQAEFPAGRVVFGPNRQDVSARKSHYLILIEPTLLAPPSTPVTAGAVQAHLSKADSDRGRTLFLSRSGANCVACHQLEDRGNVFAPDLSEIGDRADPDFLIKSILDPSADITEGFALQQIETTDGQAYAGVVVQETGRSLRLGLMDGSQQDIPTALIKKREFLEQSAMPSTFGYLLNAQQVADIVVYLQSKRADKADSTPTQTAQFTLQPQEGNFQVLLSNQPILTYYYEHSETKRPFFAHLKTPSGIQVTRNFPPIEGIDPTDHAYLHPGLSLGFATLDGENFWHNDRGGIVKHLAFTKEPEEGEKLIFGVENRYLGKNNRVVCHERAHYTIEANPRGYLLTLRSEFTSDATFYFGVKEEMGLAMRVASPLRVKKGNGHILSSEGGIDEKGTWGQPARWWDYSGTIHDRHVGMQIMSGMSDRQVWSHSRDYGVLVANPLPVDIKANRSLKTPVKPDEAFVLEYGVQVHESDTANPADLEVSYQHYRQVK